MVDSKIITLCKNKKEKGYKAMYDACVPYVFAVVSRYIAKEFERKDVVQDVFCHLFTKISAYDEDKGAFKPWIRKMTVNLCLTHLRKNKMISNVIPMDDNLNDIPGDEIRLDELETEEIRKMLSKMPAGYRTVFMMVAIDGYNHEDVSKSLGISPETSRSQYSRAKKWIKKNIIKPPKTNEYGTY